MLQDIDTKLEDEATPGIINLTNAFGELVGMVEMSFNSSEYPPLEGMGLDSDEGGDSFDSMTGVDGSYEIYVPLNDPNFDYNNAQVMAVDPLSQGTLGSVPVNLGNLGPGSPSNAPTISGSCSDDDAGGPDDDDPDCDNLGWVPAFRKRRVYLVLWLPPDAGVARRPRR